MEFQQLTIDGTSVNNSGNETAKTEENRKKDGKEPPRKLFTQDEINKMIATRIEQEKEKNARLIIEKVTEAEKLFKMNAEQKADYEREQFEKQLAEREKLISKRELIAEAKAELLSKGLPTELSECLDFSSAENYRKSLSSVETAFASSVEKKVNDKIRQTPPGISRKKISNDPFIDGLGLKSYR